MSERTEVRGSEEAVELAIRSTTDPVLAGGPLEIEMTISLRGERPAYLAVGADRTRRRPQGIRLDAALEGSEVRVGDPSGSLPNLGGPLGVAELTPQAPLRQVLLANAFLTLERLRPALEPGAPGVIRLGCTRELRLASDRDRAPSAPALPAPRLELRIPVRRDDAALADLFDRLAGEAAATVDIGARERAINILANARDPAAATRLEALASSSDQALSALARRGLSAPPG